MSLFLMLLLPFYLYGLIVNIIPYQLSLASTKIIKDRQFFSSFKMVALMFATPIFYALETWVFSAFTTDPFKWYYFLLSLPVSGVIAWIWHSNALKLLMHWRLFLLKTRKAKTYKLLRLMLDNIFTKTDEIVGS